MNGAINIAAWPLRGALVIMVLIPGGMGMGGGALRGKRALFEEMMHPVRCRNDEKKQE